MPSAAVEDLIRAHDLERGRGNRSSRVASNVGSASERTSEASVDRNKRQDGVELEVGGDLLRRSVGSG